MSSSRLAPVQEMTCTLSWRIISASERPSSAVLIAPASVIDHLAAAGEVLDVALGRVDQRRGIEVAIVVLDERGDCRHDSFLTPLSVNFR